MPNPVLDEVLQATQELEAASPPETDERVETDALVGIVRHRDLLEALLGTPTDRRDLQSELGVSRATIHRFTRWLETEGYARREGDRFRLTGAGQVVAEALVRLEREVRAADRLAPLLDAICEDHREFVVEPFADGTVTTATPEDPYRPVARFLALLEETGRFRGFNTTHVVPPTPGAADPLAGVEADLVYLPDAVESLFATDPGRARAAVERGALELRTREALPYGLAIFDDRVAVAGYDDETGAMRVLVDTASAIARGWAERVFETYRARSEPIELPAED